MSAYLPTYLPSHSRTPVPPNLPIHIIFPTYVQFHLLTYLLTCLHTFFFYLLNSQLRPVYLYTGLYAEPPSFRFTVLPIYLSL